MAERGHSDAVTKPAPLRRYGEDLECLADSEL